MWESVPYKPRKPKRGGKEGVTKKRVGSRQKKCRNWA